MEMILVTYKTSKNLGSRILGRQRRNVSDRLRDDCKTFVSFLVYS